ncbi:MAG: squalene/phytoene synthase family protein [Deltaproteobacteria bacterium]|nr:squalene/phytoene synthase family protein [Deltaproteobacteria bacterium]
MIHRNLAEKPRPSVAIPAPPQPLELDACYRYCEALAGARHHNFPVASFFAPQRLRKHIWAIYAFARTADDFADEPEFAGRRSRELDRWEERLEACYYRETPDNPVFVALQDTIEQFNLPITSFRALLAGFRADIETERYATYSDLRAYTALAAEPIGALFLYLGGYRDPMLLRSAEELASAVAFANFWQDIAADLGRGRCYVPQEDLHHFGLNTAALEAKTVSPAIGYLIRFQVARTRAMLERARPLVDQIGDDMAVEMALIWHGVARILDKIEGTGERILVERPSLSAADKALVVSKAIAWRGGSLGRRAEVRFAALLRR